MNIVWEVVGVNAENIYNLTIDENSTEVKIINECNEFFPIEPWKIWHGNRQDTASVEQAIKVTRLCNNDPDILDYLLNELLWSISEVIDNLSNGFEKVSRRHLEHILVSLFIEEDSPIYGYINVDNFIYNYLCDHEEIVELDNREYLILNT